MKEKILDLLKNIHEAKTLIEINDLLQLTTVKELQELTKNLEELVNEYVKGNMEISEVLKKKALAL